jgi:hypothetical protein
LPREDGHNVTLQHNLLTIYVTARIQAGSAAQNGWTLVKRTRGELHSTLKYGHEPKEVDTVGRCVLPAEEKHAEP